MTDGELEKKIVRYALEQGMGIVYAPDTDDVYTTETEQAAAAASGRKQRYIYADTVRAFMEHYHREQVIYMVSYDLSPLDFDEWQKVQEVLGVELNWDTARKIITILYESEIELLLLERPEYENLSIAQNFSSLSSLCETVFGVKLDPVSMKDFDYALRLAGVDILTLMQSRCAQAVSHSEATSFFT